MRVAHYILLILLSFSLTACTWFSNRHEQVYQESEAIKPMKPMKPLTAPRGAVYDKIKDYYTVPPVKRKASSEPVSIVPPGSQEKG